MPQDPPFSTRLPWRQPVNEWTRLLEERRAAGAVLLDLTESNPTRAGLPYPADAIREALADPGVLRYEPRPRGWPAAIDAVVADHARRGAAIDAGSVVLTASTSEAYGFLFKLLADPGDAVLVPQPSYPLFDFLVGLEGLRAVPYPLQWDGTWSVDTHALRAALDAEPRARVVLAVSPNNPTGNYLKRGELATVAGLAAPRGVALVVDEVFSEYPASLREDPDRVDVAACEGLPALTFSLGGLSKSAGLPQLKLGWIVAGGPPALVRAAIERLELIADSYLSVGTPVQRALQRLLELAAGPRQAILDRVRGNRRLLEDRVGPDSPVSVLPAEGGWYAVVRFPRTCSDEDLAVALLRDRGVLVHPGYFFDFPSRHAVLVLSLLPPPDVFAAGLAAVLA